MTGIHTNKRKYILILNCNKICCVRLCTEVTNKQTAKTNLNLADYVRINHISSLKKDMSTNPQLQSNLNYNFKEVYVSYFNNYHFQINLFIYENN